MRVLGRALALTTSASLALGCLATFLMMLHVSADIIARQLTSWRVPATLESVTYIYMVMIAFLPLAMVQARRQQIVVELFTELLPPRLTALLDGVVGLIGCAFLAGVTWYSAGLAWKQTLIWEAAPSMAAPVPIWPVRWMLVLGWALVTIHLLLQSAAHLVTAVTGRSPVFEVAEGRASSVKSLEI